MSGFCNLKDIYRAINAFEQKFFVENNLCINEAMMLCVLKENNLSSGDLAEQLSLPASHTSKLIKSIEDKGFITRTVDKTDKRKMLFSLNEIGLQKLEQIMPLSDEFTSLLIDSIKNI